MKLRTKLMIGLLACGIVPLVISGVMSVRTASNGMRRIDQEARSELKKLAEDQLTAIRDLKKQQIQSYFDTVGKMITNFASNPTTVAALKDFKEGVQSLKADAKLDNPAAARAELSEFYNGQFANEYRTQNGGKFPDVASYVAKLSDEGVALQLAYIKRNPHPLGKKHQLDKVDGAGKYNAVHQKMHPIVRDFLDQFNLYDVFFVDAESGDVLYSVFKEIDFGTNLKTGPLVNTALADVYRKASVSVDRRSPTLVDFAQYFPSFEAPACFLAAPVFDGDQRIGAIIFQVPLDRISQIMNDRSGLGETGETILVGPDYLPRSDSYRDPKNRSVIAAFRNPAEGKIETKGIKRALTENASGFGELTDYIGNEVVSAFCPVDVLGLKWALTAKRDTAEAFAASAVMSATANNASSALAWSTLLVGMGVALLLGGGAFMTSKSLGKIENVNADNSGKVTAISKVQAIIEFTTDGTIVGANENFLNALGYSLSEIQGKHHSMFVEPSYRDSAAYRDFWAKLGRGEFDAGEYKRIGKGGKEIWIQASYNPVFDIDGKVSKVVKFATDITAAKLRSADSSGQIDAIAKSQAVIEFNMDGTIVTANPNFCNAVGYSLEEIKGKHHSMFVDPAYKNSQEYRDFWAKLNRGEFDSGEYKRLGKGGKEIWIQASYNPILDLNGKPFKVVKYATDISAQVAQRNEAYKLRNIVDDAEAAMMMIDRDFKVTYVNKATQALLNKNLNMFRQFFPALDPNKIIGGCIDQFHKNPAHQRNLLSNPANLPYKADIKVGPMTFALNVTAVRDTAGNYVGNTLEWKDVTEERQQVVMRNQMTENLSHVVANLNTSAQNLSSTAMQLTSGAEETTSLSTTVSAAAEEMSANMNGVSASTEEMSQNVRTVAAAIEEMTASIADVASNAERAAGVAEQAALLTETSSGKISQLGTAATEIGKVIEVIQDIAEQTNLLALNATIEAARAGDAGKGFAVVATEVKELAKQTASATDDIRSRIQAIQAATTEAIGAIGEIEAVIRNVNEVSKTIAAAVDQQRVTTHEISKSVSETTLAVESVTKSIAESAMASREITQNMSKVDTAARQTASGAGLARGAGDELLGLSDKLQGLVVQLKGDSTKAA